MWTNTIGGALTALSLLACAACTTWPDEGAGGMAEYQPIENPRASRLSAVLDSLAARGADRFAASDLAEARTLLLRVRRALLGGLQRDAETDMDKIEARV